MKKICILIFIALLNISVVFSQPPQSGSARVSIEDRAKETTAWMTKELNLTQEQIVQVDSINLLFAKVQQSYFKSIDGDRDKFREAMATLSAEKENALSKILTPNQLNDYKIKIQEMRNSSNSSGRRRGSNQ